VPRDGAIEAPCPAALEAALDLVNAPFARPAASLSPIRDALQALMWDKAGILRDAAGLAEAASGLDALEAQLDATGVEARARGFNMAWQDWLNLKSLTLVSRAIVTAAIAREESRGAHWREDFPRPQDEAAGLSATLVTLDDDGRIALGWQPVAFTRVRPGQSLLAAAE
jgi:fumarate reductase flavoprotein subunit